MPQGDVQQRVGLCNAFAVCRPVARFSCGGQASFSSFAWFWHDVTTCNKRCDKSCQGIIASHLLLSQPTQYRTAGSISLSCLVRSIVKLNLVAWISAGYPRRSQSPFGVARPQAALPRLRTWRPQDDRVRRSPTESDLERVWLAESQWTQWTQWTQWILVRHESPRIRTQELANTVWTYARLCFLHEDLMVGIADRLMVLRWGLERLW